MSSEELDAPDIHDSTEGAARQSDAAAIPPYHDDRQDTVPRQSDPTRRDNLSEKDLASKELEYGQTKLTCPATFPKELERRVRRKLDWNIVPMITVIYMLAVLDRSNIGNAKIAGMQQDLNLTGNDYQWLLTIFYIPCALPPTLPLLTARYSI
jgi:hypothetical protein